MRELRFRAWVYYGERLKKPNYSRDYESLDSFFEDHDENDIDQCIEQYTGLKDKNGKEIYEGDIIDDGVSHIGKVFFNQIILAYVFEFVVDDNIVGSTFIDLYTEDIEVIGNIHENPELLKKEK